MFLSRNVLVRNALANPLGGQRRTAAKIVAGQPKGEIRAGKGRNMSRKLGWKRMPGMIIETGSAIHRVQALTGISLHEHDDEMPFDLYPGLNTVRNGRGDILATVDGVVRLSKLPGTEGTADKAFLWVDPNIRDYMVREMDRHMHRERGNEFAIEEVESRFISSPRWSHKEDREQELKDWLYNPQWDLPEESRNYSKAIPRTHLKYAKTEREKYEERDHDMFYSRMPDRSRSYAFGGKNYRYENARLEKDPVGVKEFQVQPFAYPTSGAGMARYLRRHDRRHAIKDQNRIYHLSALFGHFCPTPPQPEGAGPQQYQRHQQHQQQPPSAAGSSTPKDIREFLRTPHTRQQPQQQSQHHQQHQQQQQQPHQQRQQQQQHQQQYQQQPHQHQQQPPSAAGSSTPKDIREFLRTPPHMGDGCFAGSSTAATPGAGGAAAPPRPGKRMAGAQRGAGSGVLPFGSPTPPTPPHHQQPTAWGTPPAQPQQQQQQHTPSSWFGQSPCAGPAASSLRQAAGAQHSAQRTAGKATVSTRQQSSGVSASMNWDAPAAPEVGKGKKRNVNAPGSGGVFSSLAWDDDNGASVLANTFRAKNQQGGGDGKVARLSAKQKNILKKKLATTTPVDDPLKCPDAHRGKLRKTAFQRSAEELHDPRWDAAASGRGTLRKTPFQQALSEGDLQDPKWSADRGKLRKSAWEQSVTEAPVEDGLKWGGGAGVGGVGGGERPPQAGKSQAQLRRDKEEAANQRNLGKKAEKGEKLFGMSPQEASDRAAEKRQEEAAAKTSRPKFQRGGAAQQKGAPRGLYDKMASREKEVNRDTAKQKESQFQEQRMRSESRRQFAQRVAEEFRQQQQKRKASEAAKEERRKSEDARQEAEAAETGHRCRGTQTETTGRAFPKPQPPPQGGARKCNIFG